MNQQQKHLLEVGEYLLIAKTFGANTAVGIDALQRALACCKAYVGMGGSTAPQRAVERLLKMPHRAAKDVDSIITLLEF